MPKIPVKKPGRYSVFFSWKKAKNRIPHLAQPYTVCACFSSKKHVAEARIIRKEKEKSFCRKNGFSCRTKKVILYGKKSFDKSHFGFHRKKWLFFRIIWKKKPFFMSNGPKWLFKNDFFFGPFDIKNGFDSKWKNMKKSFYDKNGFFFHIIRKKHDFFGKKTFLATKPFFIFSRIIRPSIFLFFSFSISFICFISFLSLLSFISLLSFFTFCTCFL